MFSQPELSTLLAPMSSTSCMHCWLPSTKLVESLLAAMSSTCQMPDWLPSLVLRDEKTCTGLTASCSSWKWKLTTEATRSQLFCVTHIDINYVLVGNASVLLNSLQFGIETLLSVGIVFNKNWQPSWKLYKLLNWPQQNPTATTYNVHACTVSLSREVLFPLKVVL